IAGTVVDPNNAVVPNAKITIKNDATGASRELTTNAEGQYRAVLLDAGRYNITVSASGFAESTIQNVVVNVGSSIGLDINLAVGAVAQSIDVADTLLAVDLPNPTQTINLAAIQNLPINGRRFQDFATLTPTVQVDTERGQLSFLGQRGV